MASDDDAVDAALEKEDAALDVAINEAFLGLGKFLKRCETEGRPKDEGTRKQRRQEYLTLLWRSTERVLELSPPMAPHTKTKH